MTVAGVIVTSPAEEPGPAVLSAIVGLEIRAFGTFRVVRDGEEVELGGRLPGELLALLVVAEGAAVDHEILADRLWRGEPPASARATLQGYIARLRRALEPGRNAREAALLVTRGDGYALELSREQIDVHRFADKVAEARRTAAEGSTEETVQLLERALDLWSGAPYGGIVDVVDVAPEVARLEDLRLLAVEELVVASLALGRGAEHTPALTALAARNPLRERLHLLLARALYAGGRHVESLEVLRATRERMADDLGLDPSAELRALESAILNHEVEERPVARPGSEESLPAQPGFVGRKGELDVLRKAWSRARSGHGAAVLITGEPGIGKTLLVERFVAAAEVTPRWARCLQTPGVPPYWPWQQVLGGLPDTSDASDEGARFAFGLEVARRLQADAAEAPGVVVLDDVQWADPDSLQVLEIVLDLVARTPLLVVLTCRDVVDPSPELASILAAAGRTTGQRLALEPMRPEEVAELVREVRGREEVHASLDIDEVVRRSGGNPLFATELSRLDTAATGAVPTAALDVIRMRLTALPELARDLIALLSVAGRELPIGLLAKAVDLPLSEVDVPLASATSSGLAVETESGRLRVRHDVVREGVLADLGPGRRAELHARLADVLSSSAGAVTSTAAIAIHRSEAAAGAADRAAALACCLAAQEALDRAGAAEAADLAQRGLGHVPPGEDALRGDLLHLRGVALRRLGLLEDSLAALGAEAAIARIGGDHVRLARAALAAGGAMGGYWATAVAPSVVDGALLEEAVAHADALDDGVASDLMAALAVHRAAAGHEAVALADEAEKLGPARPLAAVAGFVARWAPDTAVERLGRARALLERSRSRSVAESTALHLLRCALIENLHAEEAAAVSARFTAAVTERGDGDMILLDLWTRSAVALAEGRYADARVLADRAVSSAPSASPAAADVLRVSRQTVEGIIAWHERTLAGVVPEVVDLAATIDSDWLTVIALAHAQAGRHEECLAVADRVLQQPGKATRGPVHTILLADAYIELGDAERAATVLPVLEAYGDTAVVFWPGATFLGPVALYRGGIKQVLGRPDAEDELRAAAAICEQFGYEPFRRRAERLLGS